MSATAEFYDEAMTAPDAPAMLALADSPWRPIYEEAARWIPHGHPVVDLGCGTGRFADELLQHGHEGGYTGVDFSPAALAEARAYLGDTPALVEQDLTTWQPDPQRAGHTTYVSLEVLEHLDDDLDLVRRVPPGHQFVFSVPNYDSAAHVRVFPNVADVFGRYQRYAAFRRWSLVVLSEQRAIHVCDTTRRLDSW